MSTRCLPGRILLDCRLFRRAKRMERDGGLDFVVDDLPGIGRSYQMTGTNGGRITVVIHHSGRRVVYGLNAGADQASTVELGRPAGAETGCDPRRGVLQAGGGGGGRGGL
jgi:hypothetical protein